MKKPVTALDAYVAERNVKFGPKCRVCALPKELLEQVHAGRAKGYSFPAIEEWLATLGHKLSVDTHFRARHPGVDDARG